MQNALKKGFAIVLTFVLVIGILQQTDLIATAATVTLTSTSATHGNFPESGSFSVITSETWSVQSTSPFIKATKSGSTVDYQLTENTLQTQRSGVILILGSNGPVGQFTVTQNGCEANLLPPTLAPKSVKASYHKFSSTILVSNKLNKWYIQSYGPFITCRKNGNQVEYTVTENPNYTERSGSIVISSGGGKTSAFTITQSGKPKPPVQLSINPTSYTCSSSAYSGSFTVNCNDTWNITGTSGNFVTATKNGNMVDYKITANAGNNQRTGAVVITAGGKTQIFTLTQNGNSSSLSPSSRTCNYRATSGSFAVNTDQTWKISSVSSSFITAKVSGKNVIYNVTENTSLSTRKGTILITLADGSTSTFTITQSGSSDYSYNSGSFYVSNPPADWFAEPCCDWLKVTISGNYVSYSCTRNTTGSSRSTTVLCINPKSGPFYQYTVTQGTN